MRVAKMVYELSSTLPKHEQFGLVVQMNRSAVSIPSNIAEGSSRKSNKDFIRFLQIALGSSFELETQLLLTVDLGLIEEDNVKDCLSHLTELQKMIRGFIKSIEFKNKEKSLDSIV